MFGGVVEMVRWMERLDVGAQAASAGDDELGRSMLACSRLASLAEAARAVLLAELDGRGGCASASSG